MPRSTRIFISLLGLLGGTFLGFIILNISVLWETQQFDGDSLKASLFPTLFSSAGNIIVTLSLLASLALLGFTLVYALMERTSLYQKTTELKNGREANKAKDAFISMLLHFIRTPLSGIRWSLKSLLDEPPKQFPKEELKKLYKSDIQALEAVEHLLNVSRASTGRIQYNFDIVRAGEFQKLVKDATDQLALEMRKKGLDLHINLPSTFGDFAVRIDKAKFSNALQSLLQNANDYSDTGLITVNMDIQQANILISITDNGIGIPQKDQQKVFLQFFRSENAKRKVPSGFGVGLYLANLFIKKHNGKILLTSKEGEGSTFTICLPLITSKTEAAIHGWNKDKEDEEQD